MNQAEHIFVGKLMFTTDNFLLAPPDNKPFVDVDISLVLSEQQFNRQQVSILGHMGERAIAGSLKTPSLIAKSVALQRDIAERAFGIFKSGQGGSSLDDWLRAERELLGS